MKTETEVDIKQFNLAHYMYIGLSHNFVNKNILHKYQRIFTCKQVQIDTLKYGQIFGILSTIKK